MQSIDFGLIERPLAGFKNGPTPTLDAVLRGALTLDLEAGPAVSEEHETGSAGDELGAGFDDGRGHVMAYFGYRKVKAVTQDRRDYSVCALGGGGDPTCSGSATSAEGNALLFETTFGRVSGSGEGAEEQPAAVAAAAPRDVSRKLRRLITGR